ncbi:hypothetical protein HO133_007449 [Letharia lupina]|uniref:Uncharacterized protein n=1 Tax=Letharia lupina TaxID=560253 RepID=A0A8H6KYS6_9LECA|nr:uncharacterized protein HO133_007449 [Letharia lupina]KAF6229333.1 hypothetical protein HO133_007449 [Letharia lupina]
MTYRLSGNLDFPRPEDFLRSERLERLCQIKADLHHFETSEPQTLASIGEQAIEDTDSDLIEYYDEPFRTAVIAPKRPRADDEPWGLECAFSGFSIRAMATWGGGRPLMGFYAQLDFPPLISPKELIARRGNPLTSTRKAAR